MDGDGSSSSISLAEMLHHLGSADEFVAGRNDRDHFVEMDKVREPYSASTQIRVDSSRSLKLHCVFRGNTDL